MSPDTGEGPTGPASPDPAGPMSPDPDNVPKILRPHKCVSYEVRGHDAMTCAQIVEYPSTKKTAAFIQQWVEGHKVYDGVLPDDRCKFADTGGGPKVKGCENNAYVSGMNLEFDADKERLVLHYSHCNTADPPVCTGATMQLFTWSTYLVKWFSMNLDANEIEVRYNIKEGRNYIESLKNDLSNELTKTITNWLTSRNIQVNSNQIQINFTCPIPDRPSLCG
jgi:hypothetical protein